MTQYDFDLPASLVNAEKEHRLSQILQDPKVRTKWEQTSVEEKNKREEKLLMETRASLKLFYLARQVIRDEKIPVTQKEIQDRAIHAHQNVPQGSEEISKEEYAMAFSNVLLMKAQDFILLKQKT